MEGTIIDVRELPEFAAGHIEGATLVPLTTVARASQEREKSNPLIPVCKSDRRAELARQTLKRLGFTTLHVLAGGMDAGGAAAKPVVKETRQPRGMEQKARTLAGTLVIATVVLGVTISRYFLIGTAVVGSGFVFAGLSNTYMMVSFLGLMPRNRVRA